MDRKNHDYLQDDLVEYVEVTDEELEEGMGHNPETAPQDSVKSVAAASNAGKKQPLRKGDKYNSEPMVKAAGAKAKEAIMAKENSDFTEDFVVEEVNKNLSQLFSKHYGHVYDDEQREADQVYSTVSKKHGKNVADDMRRHSDLSYDESFRRGKEKADAAKAAMKIRAKHKIAHEDFNESSLFSGVHKESFDFEQDLDALVESEATLSESFREKAEVIFEAALSSKLTEHVERLEEEYQTQLDEQVQQIQESLVEKIDGYLNYVVESWVEENKLAIGNGLRTEIAESFMSALHGVFTEHYIQVPDEKVDLVDGLAEKIEELEEQLNSTVQDNIGLTEAVNEFARESVIRESAKDLSEAQGEKLRSLVEDIAFDSEDAFTQKVETVKNSYFRKVSVQTQSEDEQLDEGTSKQLEVSPLMQTYLAALKK